MRYVLDKLVNFVIPYNYIENIKLQSATTFPWCVLVKLFLLDLLSVPKSFWVMIVLNDSFIDWRKINSFSSRRLNWKIINFSLIRYNWIQVCHWFDSSTDAVTFLLVFTAAIIELFQMGTDVVIKLWLKAFCTSTRKINFNFLWPHRNWIYEKLVHLFLYFFHNKKG